MLWVIWGPFAALGFGLALIPRQRTLPWVVFGLGVVASFAFVALVYFTAPPDYAHSNGTDGEMALGRWWDPTLAMVLATGGYFFWAAGAAVGLALRHATSRPRGAPEETRR